MLLQSVLAFASLLGVVFAAPGAVATADSLSVNVVVKEVAAATKQNFTYITFYNVGAKGTAYRDSLFQFRDPQWTYSIQVIPDLAIPAPRSDDSIVFKMYNASYAGEYTFANKRRGDNLVRDTTDQRLATTYGTLPDVFQLQPAEEGTYLLKVPNEDLVAEVITANTSRNEPQKIVFKPANGSDYQRWIIGKMVGESSYRWNPWNP
ncbi:hypothetical protein HMN09_01244500 [Mycena chlorophos]|uniref:Ricin B lectin domain-containing protein n=1 Tax=Mycena chlorophos TaxID=658473 RepID=A0A8H6VVP4_MYCCL|nr:hypothetical protein HMN09_01244500 [Mycena chlorophos]